MMIKTMKPILIMLAMAIGLSSAAQSVSNKEQLQQIINGISAHEKRVEMTNTVVIIHPMVKKEDRTVKHEFKGKISWQNEKPSIVYTSAEQLSGPKAKKNYELGKSYPFKNAVAQLKENLEKFTFTEFVPIDTINIQNTLYKGFYCKATNNDKTRAFKVAIKENQLFAAKFEFEDGGPSHENGTSDKSTLWMFEKNGDNFFVSKRIEVTTRKSASGVPTLGVNDTRYYY